MDALVTTLRPASAAAESALLEALIENSPDALVIVDADGTIFRINPAFARMCGHDANAMMGRPVREALPRDEAGCQLADAIEEAFEQRKTVQHMIACQHGHGFELDIDVFAHAVIESGALRYVVAQLRPAWRDNAD